MRSHTKTRLGALGTLLVAGVTAGGVLWLTPQLTQPTTYATDLCRSIELALDGTRTLIGAAEEGGQREELTTQETHLADQLQQARDAGCSEEATNSEGESPPSSAAATETTAPESTTQDSSSADEPAATSEAPAPVVDDSWVPRYFVLENDPATPWNFGPAVDPATAVEGFRPRMEADPALLCANGGLILNGSDGGADCVRSLTASKSARDAYLNATFDQIADMHVETREPQWVDTAYMAMGEDGIPRVIQTGIQRTAAYHVLVVTTKDGRVYLFRLECGYQWDSGAVQEAVLPEDEAAPVQAAPEQPYIKAAPCINGGSRDEDARCTPPPGEEVPPGSTPPGSTPPGSTPPGSTPPGSTPPSTPPSSTPPSTPPTTVVTTTYDDSKTSGPVHHPDLTSTMAVTGDPAATSQPNTDPAQPGTTAATTQRAPDADPRPSPTPGQDPAPSVDPSPSVDNTGDAEPGEGDN